MDAGLKLFVWDEVFCDYTCGIAFALAHDAEEARQMIFDIRPWGHGDLAVAPKVYEAPVARAVSGGG